MNLDFTYYNPTRIHFGKNALDKLVDELAMFGDNILLVYGKESIKKIGLYNEILVVSSKKDDDSEVDEVNEDNVENESEESLNESSFDDIKDGSIRGNVIYKEI